MSRNLAVVYASSHGHVARIAQYVADVATSRGVSAGIFDVTAAKPFHAAGYDGFVIMGSVHFGHHAKRLERFVVNNLKRLTEVPSTFMSVSGSAASLHGRTEAARYLDAFLARTGWHPDLSICVAGAILYTKYNWITRQLMKFASRVAGRATDTTQDFDYTDWFAVDAFAQDVVNLMDRYAKTA